VVCAPRSIGAPSMRQPAGALAVVIVIVSPFAELEAEGKEHAVDAPALFAAPLDDAVEVELVDRAILDTGPGLDPDGAGPSRGGRAEPKSRAKGSGCVVCAQ